MGLHGGGQGQGEAGSPDPGQGFNSGDGCPVDGEGQIDEAVPIGSQATATARGEEGQGPTNVQRLGRGQGVLAGLEIHCPPGPWHGEPRFRIRAGQTRDFDEVAQNGKKPAWRHAMTYSPHLLLTVSVPLWMPVMTGATAAMVAMGMIGLIWLRQDMNARFDRLEADMKELRDLIMKVLARNSVTAP